MEKRDELKKEFLEKDKYYATVAKKHEAIKAKKNVK
jgi:hypothetical protein